MIDVYSLMQIYRSGFALKNQNIRANTKTTDVNTGFINLPTAINSNNIVSNITTNKIALAGF